MDDVRRQAIGKWARDLVISVVIVPAILVWLQMSPPVIIAAGILCLFLLKVWEWGYLAPATWTPDGKVAHGKARATAGITLVLIAVAGFYTSLHWSLFRLPTAQPKGSVTELFSPAGKLQSTVGKTIYVCSEQSPTQTMTRKEFEQTLKVYGESLGVSATVSDIPDGLKIEFSADTPEGKIRLGSIKRWTLEVRTTGKRIIATSSVEFADLLGVLGELFQMMPVDPTNKQTIEAMRMIEQLIGVPEGGCQII
jgi:hypothetical protein